MGCTKYPVHLVLWLAVGLAITACQNGAVTATNTAQADSVELAFASLVGVSEINRLVILEEAPGFAPGGGTTRGLHIINQSTNSLTFPPDFGTRLFFYSQGAAAWVEIENHVNVNGTADVTLQPAGDMIPDRYLLVNPSIPSNFDGKFIRVLVAGQVKSDEAAGATLAVATLDIPWEN